MGGTIGSFAEVRFTTSDERVLNFLELVRETSARFAKHNVIGRKPVIEFLGPDSSAITFRIEVSAQFGVSPKSIIKKLDSVIQSGRNSNFVLGGWNLGRYVITKKSEAFGIITNRGGVVSVSLNITLEEYA